MKKYFVDIMLILGALLMVGVIFVISPAYASGDRTGITQKGSVSVSAASGVASGATSTVTVTVPGAALGDACLASFSNDASNFSLSCTVTAANTAKVTLTQLSTAGVALSSGTLRVFRFPAGTQ